MSEPRFRIWSEGDGLWSVLDIEDDYKRIEVFRSRSLAQEEALRLNRELGLVKPRRGILRRILR